MLIGGGANGIVGAQENRLVWTVKGGAPGMSRLAVGKIMAATAFATGRVEQKQQDGSNVRVTLAPVGLTDVWHSVRRSARTQREPEGGPAAQVQSDVDRVAARLTDSVNSSGTRHMGGRACWMLTLPGQGGLPGPSIESHNAGSLQPTDQRRHGEYGMNRSSSTAQGVHNYLQTMHGIAESPIDPPAAA